MRAAGFALATTLFVAACSTQVVSSPTSGTLPPETTTTADPRPGTTSPPTTTTTLRAHVGLYRVDPATLAPHSGAEPLLTGDWVTGHVADNGEWVGLNVWVEPDHSSFLVLEVGTGAVVTDRPRGLSPVGVGDDGVVYSFSYLPYSGSRFRKLPPGADELETVFDDFPLDFSFWGPSVVLGPDGAAWLGTFGGALRARVAGMVVVDLATGAATTHAMPELTLGAVADRDVGDWVISEEVEPALVWDASRRRVLVVHGVETKVTTVDLETGEVVTYDVTSPTSWLDHLLTWLIPPASAKEGHSSYGTERRALLTPSGDRLYVASSVSAVVDETDLRIETTPRGVEVIDTETWELAHRWEIPASEIALSPDGRYLVTTGLSWSESLTDFEERVEDVLVIDLESHEIVGRFEPTGTLPEIQFAPDGSYLYISEGIIGEDEHRIEIVDLATMKVVGSSQGRLVGGTFLVKTLQP